MVDGKSGVGVLVMGKSTERDKFPGTGGHVNRLEGLRTRLEFRRDFQHDVILVDAFIDVGDLALAEGVAQGVVNIQHIDAETAGGGAIDNDGAFEPVHLLVGIDVAQIGNFGQVLLKNRSPMSEIVEAVGLERVLILRGTAAAADAEILNGLQVQSGTGNSGSLGADTRDDLVGAQLPLVERLELGEHASRAATAAAAGEGSYSVNGRILRNDVGKSAHLFRHGGKGEILIALNVAVDAASVLL